MSTYVCVCLNVSFVVYVWKYAYMYVFMCAYVGIHSCVYVNVSPFSLPFFAEFRMHLHVTMGF